MVLGRKTSTHFSSSAFQHRHRWNRINSPDGVFSAFAFAAGPIREAGVEKFFFPLSKNGRRFPSPPGFQKIK
jgi:hypothetical protein